MVKGQYMSRAVPRFVLTLCTDVDKMVVMTCALSGLLGSIWPLWWHNCALVKATTTGPPQSLKDFMLCSTSLAESKLSVTSAGHVRKQHTGPFSNKSTNRWHRCHSWLLDLSIQQLAPESTVELCVNSKLMPLLGRENKHFQTCGTQEKK